MKIILKIPKFCTLYSVQLLSNNGISYRGAEAAGAELPSEQYPQDVDGDQRVVSGVVYLPGGQGLRLPVTRPQSPVLRDNQTIKLILIL